MDIQRMEEPESIVRDASRRVSQLEDASLSQNSDLVAWLTRNPAHLAVFLEMAEVEHALHQIDPRCDVNLPEPYRD